MFLIVRNIFFICDWAMTFPGRSPTSESIAAGVDECVSKFPDFSFRFATHYNIRTFANWCKTMARQKGMVMGQKLIRAIKDRKL